MKTNRLFQFFLIAAVSGAGSLKAQEVNIEPADYKDIFKKTLVVEIPDTTRMKRQGTAVNYPQGNYGEMLQKAIEEHWKLNEKVEFKSAKDIEKMMEKGDSKFTYMYITKHPSAKEDNMIWVLNYTRISRQEQKIDYAIYLPAISNRADKKYYQYDLNFTISLMQENMKYNQKNNEKLNAADYGFIEAANSCLRLKETTVAIDPAILFKDVDDRVVKKSLKRTKFSLMSSADIDQNWSQIKDTSSILMIYPREFMKTTTSAFGELRPVYQKMIYSATDYKVIGSVGNSRKDNPLIGVMADDLASLSKCEKKKK